MAEWTDQEADVNDAGVVPAEPSAALLALIEQWRRQAMTLGLGVVTQLLEGSHATAAQERASVFQSCADELDALVRATPAPQRLDSEEDHARVAPLKAGAAPAGSTASSIEPSPSLLPERVKKLARGFAAEWLRPNDPDSATPVLLDTLETAMLAFFACASRFKLDPPQAKYGCTQCQNDFSHAPLTRTVEGIPARTYFFCSPECRFQWQLGMPSQARATSPAPDAVDPIAAATGRKVRRAQESSSSLEPADAPTPTPAQQPLGFHRLQVESAIGFLSAPDRERILERIGYTDAEIAAYFRARGEAALPCLQPREGA